MVFRESSPAEPTSSPEMQTLHEDIQIAADKALEAIASERGFAPDEVQFQQVCGPVTNSMITTLSEQGYKFKNMRGERHIARVGWRYDEDGKPLPIDMQPEKSAVVHRFPVIDTDGTPEGEVVADATWQQFLTPEQRTADLPKVLVGTREQVRDLLRSHGLNDADLLRIWEKPEAPNKPKPHAV